jgi:predicted transcriptional regulator
MTLTLHLPPELEHRLAEEARRRRLSPDEYTMELLDKHLPPQDQRMELVTLLQAWIAEGDAGEQRETGEYLIRALDEDRLSERPLFPRDLKDVTW